MDHQVLRFGYSDAGAFPIDPWPMPADRPGDTKIELRRWFHDSAVIFGDAGLAAIFGGSC